MGMIYWKYTGFKQNLVNFRKFLINSCKFTEYMPILGKGGQLLGGGGPFQYGTLVLDWHY